MHYSFTYEQRRWSSVSSGDAAAARPRRRTHISSSGRVHRPAACWRWRRLAAGRGSRWSCRRSVPDAPSLWHTDTTRTDCRRVGRRRDRTSDQSSRTAADANAASLDWHLSINNFNYCKAMAAESESVTWILTEFVDNIGQKSTTDS